MDTKNLKLLIIILILFALIIVGAIVALSFQETNNNVIQGNIIENVNSSYDYIYEDEQEDYEDEENEELDTQNVTDKSMLNSLNNNINKYFNYIKEGNMDAVNELGGNSKYTITNNVKYIINAAIHIEDYYQNIYYTHGVLKLANEDLTTAEQELYVKLYLDLQNGTYKIKILTQEEILSDIEREEEYKEIPQGTYNIFEYEEINDADLMQIYLDDYSFNIFNNTERAYNMLDPEYRAKRFNTFEEFVKYLAEKKEQLSNINLLQYKAYEGDDCYVYEGTDEKGNYYIIKEYGYMKYNIMLDNYTLQEDYSYESEEVKIKKSVETFIEMINSANYSGAYNLLEPTFKTTHFPTEEDFVNYIKTNWFERNIIAKKEITEAGTCIVSMREKISTTSSKMEKEFIVILGEGMDFAIQFNI